MNYTKGYFENRTVGSRHSAEIIVPIIYSKLKPKSVLDVGCGTGTWLKVWSENGTEITGIDGKWVDQTLLKIEKKNFLQHDLEQPIDLKRKFNLVTSLEVAEHIHEDKKDVFLDTLTRHSDVILFSAAIPWQGGTNHFNEQYLEYWIESFKVRGYVFLDPFRHLLWRNEEIKSFYKQNIVLFVKEDQLNEVEFFKDEHGHAKRSLVSVVHPDMFEKVQDPNNKSLKNQLKLLCTLLLRNLRKIITR